MMKLLRRVRLGERTASTIAKPGPAMALVASTAAVVGHGQSHG